MSDRNRPPIHSDSQPAGSSRPAVRWQKLPATPAADAPAPQQVPLPLAYHFPPRLGQLLDNSGSFALPPQKGRRHTHIIGGSGMGKSKLLERLIQQDLEDPEAGLCLIDPHGPVYDALVDYISHERPDLAQRVVLFNPSDEHENVLGFNPFGTFARKNPLYALNMMVRSVLKVWGQDSTKDTPRLTRWLTNIFYLVLANDLTLVEAAVLLDTQKHNPYLDRLLETAHNHFMHTDWKDFMASTKTQKEVQLEGAANRLRKFLGNDRIRLMLGQQENILDVERIVADKKILLVKLHPTTELDHEDNQLIGVLLITEFFRVALTRTPQDNPPPFFLYIDEFAQFVSRDIARILEEARKFGLFLVLAHQHVTQLKQEDEYLLASVLGLCRNRIVFGGLNNEDARLMSKEIHTGFRDLKQVKHTHVSTKFRPQEEWRADYTVGQSEQEGGSEALARAFGERLTVGEALARSLEQGISLADSTSRQRSVTHTQGSETGSAVETGRRQETGESSGVRLEVGQRSAEGQQNAHTETDARRVSRGQSSGQTRIQQENQQQGQETVRVIPATVRPGEPRSQITFQDRSGSNQTDSLQRSEQETHSSHEEHAAADTNTMSRERSRHRSEALQSGWDERRGNHISNTQSQRQSRAMSIAETLARQHTETRHTAERETRTQEQSHSVSADETRTTGIQWNRGRNTQVTFRKATTHEEFQEEKPEFFTLSEIEEMDIGRIMRQPVGTALIQLENMPPVQVKIDLPLTPPVLKYSDRRRERLRQAVFRAGQEWYLSVTDAQAAIARRQTAVFGHVLHLGFGPPPALPEDPTSAAPDTGTAADSSPAAPPRQLHPAGASGTGQSPAQGTPPAADSPFPDDD